MPEAAVRLGDRRPQEAELGHLLEHLPVDLAAGVPFADVGQDLGLDEGAGGVADEPVLVGEGEVDHERASGGGHVGAPPHPTAAPGSGGRVAILYSVGGYQRRASHRPRRSRRSQHVARPGPLHGPQLVARGRPPPVRHGRAGLPRLRQRDRRDRAGSRPSAGDGRRAWPGRPADGAGARDRLRGANRQARFDACGHLPRPTGCGAVPQLRIGDDRRGDQARAARDRASRDPRLPRRLPRPDHRGDERHQLLAQLPAWIRAAAPEHLPAAVPGGLPRLRR